ncbi:hypothetical protein GCWU000341_00202 [Oribacterium sp. oral taxon 078 str. F0262]|nr:hypothetical protein GCWU000341_00202 [Oribacterium sp. oral taxon 078 str. F0262]
MIGFLPNFREFQSTLPSRGATIGIPNTTEDKKISIHAPLAGSDKMYQKCILWTRHFNPRSPRGERLYNGGTSDMYLLISIHAPLAGSDAKRFLWRGLHCRISIHAPLAGSDLRGLLLIVILTISIHAPLAGSDHLPRGQQFHR